MFAHANKIRKKKPHWKIIPTTSTSTTTVSEIKSGFQLDGCKKNVIVTKKYTHSSHLSCGFRWHTHIQFEIRLHVRLRIDSEVRYQIIYCMFFWRKFKWKPTVGKKWWWKVSSRGYNHWKHNESENIDMYTYTHEHTSNPYPCIHKNCRKVADTKVKKINTPNQPTQIQTIERTALFFSLKFKNLRSSFYSMFVFVSRLTWIGSRHWRRFEGKNSAKIEKGRIVRFAAGSNVHGRNK